MACFVAEADFKVPLTIDELLDVMCFDSLDELMEYIRDNSPSEYKELTKGSGKYKVFFFDIRHSGTASHIKAPEGYSIIKKG